MTKRFSHKNLRQRVKREISSRAVTPGEQRAVDALRVNLQPTKRNLEKYNRENINKVVSEINCATVHFSGNCSLLSNIVMYNLLNEHDCYLAGSNTYPILKSVDGIEDLFFGQELEDTGATCYDCYQLKDELLRCYRETKERVFCVDVKGYKLPIVGKAGHAFNAVIFEDEKGVPFVQFVDAWKRNHMPTTKEIQKQYSGDSIFFKSYYCPDKALIRDFSMNEVDTINKLDVLCTEYLSHLESGMNRKKHTNAPSPESKIKIIKELQASLQESPPSKALANFYSNFEKNKSIIEVKRDSFAIAFLKAVAAIFTIGLSTLVKTKGEKFSHSIAIEHKARLKEIKDQSLPEKDPPKDETKDTPKDPSTKPSEFDYYGTDNYFGS